MKQKTVTIIVTLVVLIFLVLVGLYGFTVIPIKDVTTIIEDATFNPIVYVDEAWEPKIISVINEKAVDLSALLSEIQPNADGIVDKNSLITTTGKYGLVTVGEKHVYMVKGAGKVVNVNETSKATIEVALDGYTGPIKVLMYVGSRVASDDTTAVRDAVGITINDGFPDQTPFGQAAAEITRRALAEVNSGLDAAALAGKTISFKGAFNISTFNRITIVVKEISVVPIEIKVDNP